MAEIKGEEQALAWLIVAAFRYAINRHGTQAMRGIEKPILDNLHLLNDDFIRQFIHEIEWEQRAQAIDEEEQGKEKNEFFYRLKVHVSDYINYLQKQKQNEDAQKMCSLLNDVMEACKTAKVNLPPPWWRQVEDTNYLTPLLNELREEVERREQNEKQWTSMRMQPRAHK